MRKGSKYCSSVCYSELFPRDHELVEALDRDARTIALISELGICSAELSDVEVEACADKLMVDPAYFLDCLSVMAVSGDEIKDSLQANK